MTARRLTFILVACCTLFVGGCERAADVNSPQHVMTDGVAFDYPGNWDISKNELQKTGRYLQIRSPGSAVVMVRIFQPGIRVKLNDYAHSIGEALEKQFAQSALLTPGQAMTYAEIKDPARHSVSIHYSVKLAAVDVPHTMTLREWNFAGNQVVVTMQVADKHAYQAEPGFEQIMSTLKPAR